MREKKHINSNYNKKVFSLFISIYLCPFLCLYLSNITGLSLNKAPTQAASSTFDAFQRLATGKEARKIADKFADPNRPSWEQYKKVNEDKLDMVGIEIRRMTEYRAELDRERERRLAERIEANQQKRKLYSDSDEEERESDSDSESSSSHKKKKQKKEKKSKKEKKRKEKVDLSFSPSLSVSLTADRNQRRKGRRDRVIPVTRKVFRVVRTAITAKVDTVRVDLKIKKVT